MDGRREEGTPPARRPRRVLPAPHAFTPSSPLGPALSKQGKPHWGKNFDRTYMHPRCPVRDTARDFAGLLAVRDRHDPQRVMEPPLMAAVAARQANPLYPRCALDHACYW